jgi:hypothetical protein
MGPASILHNKPSLSSGASYSTYQSPIRGGAHLLLPVSQVSRAVVRHDNQEHLNQTLAEIDVFLVSEICRRAEYVPRGSRENGIEGYEGVSVQRMKGNPNNRRAHNCNINEMKGKHLFNSTSAFLHNDGTSSN